MLKGEVKFFLVAVTQDFFLILLKTKIFVINEQKSFDCININIKKPLNNKIGQQLKIVT